MHDNSVPELRTYINGNLESGSPSTIPSVPTTTPRIGGAVDVNIFGDRKRPLDAGFKEICISNVTRYFGLTHSVPTTAKTPDANTVAQWSFADEVGSRLFMDSSGNGNHLVGALSAQMVATGGPPSIKVSPGRVRVEAMVGSNAVIAAPLKLQNVTGSAIGYEMVTNSPFTTFLPPSGTIPAGQSVDVSAGIVTVGLDRNIYDFNIRAKNTARPGVDFFNVPTRLTMYNAGPRIDMFWPPTLTGRDTLPLLVQTGQTRGVSFTIENVGTADFDVTPTTNYGPLRSQLPGATMLMPGEQLPVSLSFDATAVTPRLLDINFGARGMATNSPQRLFMPTTVYESGPGLHLGPETLKVYAEVGQTPPTRGFVISNPGTMPVDFSIVDNAAWVTLDPPSGTLSPLESQVIRVDFTRSDFPVGVFRPLVTATGVGVGGFRRSTIELSVGEILP
jgi:hypothetical protein